MAVESVAVARYYSVPKDIQTAIEDNVAYTLRGSFTWGCFDEWIILTGQQAAAYQRECNGTIYWKDSDDNGLKVTEAELQAIRQPFRVPDDQWELIECEDDEYLTGLVTYGGYNTWVEATGYVLADESQVRWKPMCSGPRTVTEEERVAMESWRDERC